MQVQYVTNEQGKKTAVQLPMKEWEALQKDLRKLDVLKRLKQAFKEMRQHEQGKLKPPTTEQLLAQL